VKEPEVFLTALKDSEECWDFFIFNILPAHINFPKCSCKNYFALRATEPSDAGNGFQPLLT